MIKTFFIATLLFFLVIGFTSYWETDSGGWGMLATFGLIIIFGLLLLGLLFQTYLSFKEKFKLKSRLVLIFTMTFVLLFTYYYPFGLINFKSAEGNDIFIAERDGVANCNTTFRLKENNKFTESSVCFGTTLIKGTYVLKGDTLYFSNVDLGRNEKEYYKFAVIKHYNSTNKKIIGDLVRYKDFGDTLPHELWITKNDLTPKLGQDK